MNITGSPYVLSADDNKIIVLGCNSFAYMRSHSVSIADDVVWQLRVASLKKQAETLFPLIYCERKTLSQLKNQAEKDRI